MFNQYYQHKIFSQIIKHHNNLLIHHPHHQHLVKINRNLLLYLFQQQCCYKIIQRLLVFKSPLQIISYNILINLSHRQLLFKMYANNQLLYLHHQYQTFFQPIQISIYHKKNLINHPHHLLSLLSRINSIQTTILSYFCRHPQHQTPTLS